MARSSINPTRAGLYCVYTHSANGKVFYVGCGRGNRPYSADNRNYLWHKKVAQVGSFHVRIVQYYVDKDDALKRERVLILKHAADCNIASIRTRRTSAERLALLGLERVISYRRKRVDGKERG